MQILVVGATGATGRLLVEQLLDRGHKVRAVVRDTTNLSEDLLKNDRLAAISANLLDLSDADLAQAADGCEAVASCLGHNMSWKGIYGR